MMDASVLRARLGFRRSLERGAGGEQFAPPALVVWQVFGVATFYRGLHHLFRRGSRVDAKALLEQGHAESDDVSGLQQDNLLA